MRRLWEEYKANKTLVATGDKVLLEFGLPFHRCQS